MGYRELLLLLGVIVLFGVTILSTNRQVLDQKDARLQWEFENYALSLAQSFIEEAATKAFDENEVNGNPSIKDDFTDSNNLGPDGEVYPAYDDIDDYNGYTEIDTTTRDLFSVSIKVGYVQEDDPQVVVGSKEFYKRMTVTVSNSYLVQPLQFSSVFGFLNN